MRAIDASAYPYFPTTLAAARSSALRFSAAFSARRSFFLRGLPARFSIAMRCVF
jgi:hypothetical protein